jgi:hypothetical protein
MSASLPRARVVISTRSVRSLRLSGSIGRLLIYAAVVVGLANTARYLVAPPRPQAPSGLPTNSPDPAAEAFASLFARAYLSWSGNDPTIRERALAAFLGTGADPDAGLHPPAAGSQNVTWVQVAQSRQRRPGDHVYTVAAMTDHAGLVYLSVEVVRAGDGSLELDGYPALVGPPATHGSDLAGYERWADVQDSGLTSVVQRALGNYLAGAGNDLAADLTAQARVSLPGPALTLVRIQALKWRPDHASVEAVVQAVASDGADYTLAYELDVARVGGRWEVGAIQADPTT